MAFSSRQPKPPPSEEWLAAASEWRDQVEAVLSRGATYLPADRLRLAFSFVRGGEPAEGLVSLAWAIVNDHVQVPASLIAAIREHIEGLIDPEDLPSNLDEYAGPEPVGLG